MKFAIVNGQRQEAQPNLSGKCPTCDHPMVAKCGEVRMWHWAHQGSRFCDPWWENETEWHRAWKGQFPVNWQEVVHQTETGEKHISDVKTDRAQLLNAWKEGVPAGANSLVRRAFSDNSVLLREWAGSDAPIFFDLGEMQVLWWLFAKSTDGPAYVAPYSRARFIESHRGGAPETAREFDEFVKDIPKLVGDYESHLRAQASQRTPTQPLQGFQQNLARRNRLRKRL